MCDKCQMTFNKKGKLTRHMNTNHEDEDPTPSSQDDESVHSQLPLTYVIDNELDRETEVLEEFIEEEELLVELERSAGQLIELEKPK